VTVLTDLYRDFKAPPETVIPSEKICDALHILSSINVSFYYNWLSKQRFPLISLSIKQQILRFISFNINMLRILAQYLRYLR